MQLCLLCAALIVVKLGQEGGFFSKKQKLTGRRGIVLQI